jgi:ribosomal-protein-alanine N-acetyltransferase
MRREDVDQVVVIDKEAFPTQWPPTNYRNELQNRLAHYIVVYQEGEPVKNKPRPLNTSFFSCIRGWFGRNQKTPDESSKENYIVGFAGCWILADEAHVTEIAVRASYRYQGIGQLLIITLIEMGVELKANLATLEVRLSNTTAHKLYEKLGFEKVGLRKGYYTDNREDALIMTISDIKSPVFQAKLSQLKQALIQRWGLPCFPVLPN